MKRIIKTPICLLISAFSLSLVSCNINYFTVHKKDISFCSLINQDKGGKDISEYKKGDVSTLTVNEEELVPYLTLEAYNSMLTPYVNSGYQYRVSDVGGSAMLMVTTGSTYVFAVEFNQLEKSVSVSGSTNKSLTTDKDLSKTSLYLGMDVDSEITTSSARPTTHSWSNTTYRVFVHDNSTYFPLSLLDTVIAPYTGIHHYYSYKNIYQYLSDEELTSVIFYKGGEASNAFAEANEVIKNDLKTMPRYLREDRYNAFLFIFDNLYGLKTTLKIDSMIELFKNNELLDNFMSDDDYKRNQSFANIFAFLDDGHTAVTDKFVYPWNTGTFNTYGPKLQNMVKVATQLTMSRKAFYDGHGQEVGSIVYLNDEVAYFPFNGFSFSQNAYKEDGSIRDDLYKDDSFFFIADCLKTIKAKGGVKKVIIDISINGGGTVGVLMKVLSLLSSNNSSKLFFKLDKANVIEKDITKVDTNLDGKYDLEDVYGDDFKFYLLSSCYSFSCGNALPFLAQKQNIATIIGQNSGGGECAVAEAYLPSGEYFVHSSLTHIGFVENDYDRWIGAEEAAKAEKLIDYKDFYDIPTLLSSL